jgi:sterol desaturase/sphingolipid hydroxylase (fatty acid hydroxylase superfamily)
VDARAIALAVPFFLVTIALEVAIDARRRVAPEQRWYRFRDAITSLACGVGQQVLAVAAIGALQVGAYAWLFEHARVATLPSSAAWVWALGFVLLDLGYYAYHRASHRVGVLWAMHVVHHQSEEYNLTTALRQSWFTALVSWVFYAPMAVLGFPPIVFVLCLTANTLYQYGIHVRGVRRLGPLEAVLNTPSHHRVHHGIDPEYIDKNYGGVFIVWDRLFGTFTREEREPAYGTVKPLASFNPFWANVEGFARIASIARRTRRLRDKAWAAFAPPEWMPDDLGGPVTVPPVDHAARVKYDVRGDRGVTLYVALQFVVAALGVAALNWFHASLGPAPRWLAVGILMAALATWGGLFERRSWAVPLEIGRLAAVVLLGFVLPLGERAPAAIGLAAAFAVGSAVALAAARGRGRGVGGVGVEPLTSPRR